MKRCRTLPLQKVEVGVPVCWRIANFCSNRWQRGSIVEVEHTAFVKVRPRHPLHHAHWLDVRALRIERPPEPRAVQS